MLQKLSQNKQFCPQRADTENQRVQTPHCWVDESKQSQSGHPSTDLSVFLSQRMLKHCIHKCLLHLTNRSSSSLSFTDFCGYLSRPLVGSSRKSNRGLMSISRAMLTLLFSPPLIPRKCQFPITVSAQSWRPISMIVLSTSARFSCRGMLSGSRRRAEYHMVSLTVNVPIKVSSWVTYA